MIYTVPIQDNDFSLDDLKARKVELDQCPLLIKDIQEKLEDINNEYLNMSITTMEGMIIGKQNRGKALMLEWFLDRINQIEEQIKDFIDKEKK